MKKMIIGIIGLLLILTAGILEHFHVDKVFNEFSARAEKLGEYIAAEDESAALNCCTELSQWWQDNRYQIEAFSYSTDIRSISVTIGEIEGSLMAGDFVNAQSKIISLQYLIDNVHNVVDFNWSDIV